MEWFRFYTGALDDPKVQRLDPCLFKHWVNLLCLAGKAEPRGVLPSVDDIAFGLRVSAGDAGRIVGELLEKGLLDEIDGDLVPHNWNGRQRQSDDVTARVRKHRSEAKKDETLHETLPSRSIARAGQNRTDTDTETEQTPPSGGETSHAPAREALPLPSDLEMTDDDVAAAMNAGVEMAQLEGEWAHFTNYYAARQGERRTDWHAQWRTWLGKRPQFPVRTAPNGTAPKREKPAQLSGVVTRSDGNRQRKIIGR